MGLIDQMKYAKMLYLADVLEDIQNEMRKDWRCRNFAYSIGGIVSDLRSTIAETTLQNIIECEKIEIKRIECSHIGHVMYVPRSERERFVNSYRHGVQDELLHSIEKSKLIRVSEHEHDNGDITFAASLIVGIEKQPYVPEEPLVTPVDNMAKRMLDEKKE